MKGGPPAEGRDKTGNGNQILWEWVAPNRARRICIAEFPNPLNNSLTVSYMVFEQRTSGEGEFWDWRLDDGFRGHQTKDKAWEDFKLRVEWLEKAEKEGFV